ncbi:hypothetical protein BS50DRAFT_221034 [Corynespora cassiicola Philippines]|uniref:Uncharacterized protein n=1 Tax=Corynespora cassiicola Philippines TaxID=1448308 RepID=A0A2T2N367_CORCC|nr:hypothetical protein BS50DRAFT_221034 [Corynespora cassiicola Philippines]
MRCDAFFSSSSLLSPSISPSSVCLRPPRSRDSPVVRGARSSGPTPDGKRVGSEPSPGLHVQLRYTLARPISICLTCPGTVPYRNVPTCLGLGTGTSPQHQTVHAPTDPSIRGGIKTCTHTVNP